MIEDKDKDIDKDTDIKKEDDMSTELRSIIDRAIDKMPKEFQPSEPVIEKPEIEAEKVEPELEAEKPEIEAGPEPEPEKVKPDADPVDDIRKELDKIKQEHEAELKALKEVNAALLDVVKQKEPQEAEKKAVVEEEVEPDFEAYGETFRHDTEYLISKAVDKILKERGLADVPKFIEQSSQERFYNKLLDTVPDYNELVRDKKFIDFANEKKYRIENIKIAFSKGDHQTIAEIVGDYKDIVAGKIKTAAAPKEDKKAKLEEHISPTTVKPKAVVKDASVKPPMDTPQELTRKLGNGKITVEQFSKSLEQYTKEARSKI